MASTTRTLFFAVFLLGAFTTTWGSEEEDIPLKLGKSMYPKKYQQMDLKKYRMVSTTEQPSTTFEIIAENNEIATTETGETGVSTLEPKILEAGDLTTSEEEIMKEIGRTRKSATATFCVEIRPSNPYQKPFQVCEPESPQPHYGYAHKTYPKPMKYQQIYEYQQHAAPPSNYQPHPEPAYHPAPPAYHAPPQPHYQPPAPHYQPPAPQYQPPAQPHYQPPPPPQYQPPEQPKYQPSPPQYQPPEQPKYQPQEQPKYQQPEHPKYQPQEQPKYQEPKYQPAVKPQYQPPPTGYKHQEQPSGYEPQPKPQSGYEAPASYQPEPAYPAPQGGYQKKENGYERPVVVLPHVPVAQPYHVPKPAYKPSAVGGDVYRASGDSNADEMEVMPVDVETNVENGARTAYGEGYEEEYGGYGGGYGGYEGHKKEVTYVPLPVYTKTFKAIKPLKLLKVLKDIKKGKYEGGYQTYYRPAAPQYGGVYEHHGSGYGAHKESSSHGLVITCQPSAVGYTGPQEIPQHIYGKTIYPQSETHHLSAGSAYEGSSGGYGAASAGGYGSGSASTGGYGGGSTGSGGYGGGSTGSGGYGGGSTGSGGYVSPGTYRDANGVEWKHTKKDMEERSGWKANELIPNEMQARSGWKKTGMEEERSSKWQGNEMEANARTVGAMEDAMRSSQPNWKTEENVASAASAASLSANPTSPVLLKKEMETTAAFRNAQNIAMQNGM